MSFWATAAKAARLSREYSDAWDAALLAVEQGMAIPEVVRAFAAETDNAFDDQAAEVLIEGFERALGVLEEAVRLASKLSPTIAEWGVRALVWETRLRKMRGD